MMERNPMAEDMFEKARRAFFTTTKASLERSGTSAELPKSEDEHTPEEVASSPSDTNEAR
jgi:hypothetical protein